MNSTFSRRNFIKRLAAASLPTSLSFSSLSSAQSFSPRDHFFVILNIWGAMDVTLSLDPWLKAELPDPQDMFIEYSPSEVLQLSTGIKAGPALASLQKHAADIAILNGVFMAESDVGHETLREYMITGSLKREASSFALEVSSHFGQQGLGSIIDSGMFLTGTHLVSAIEDIKTLDSIESKVLEFVSLIPSKDPFSFVKSFMKIPGSVHSIEAFIDLKKKLATEEELSESYLIAAAFLSGSAMTAEIDFQDFDLGVNNLDTHSDHPKIHFERQIMAWEIVDDFFTTFKKIPYGNKGKTLFDHTTFMISNEFARTPFLNPSDGKDHNSLTNSLLFAGKGIQGGQVIGGSRLIPRKDSPSGTSYHIALPIDYSTGMATFSQQPNSHMVFPENVIATLCHLFSLPQNQHPSLLASTKPILPLLKI